MGGATESESAGYVLLGIIFIISIVAISGTLIWRFGRSTSPVKKLFAILILIITIAFFANWIIQWAMSHNYL